MYSSRFAQVVCVAALAWYALPAGAVTISIDYSRDTTGFFANGSQARATMEAAASYYSTILTDTLASIQKPPTFHAAAPRNGTAEFNWRLNFPHPVTQITTYVINPTIPTNQFRVYVGARDLPSGTLGVGGPGGWNVDGVNASGSFSNSEVTQIEQIQEDFIELVETRGEMGGFARWGGALTVDSNASWHYNYTTQPTAGTNDNDLYSVLIHELGHALGFGASSEWGGLIDNSKFIGSQAMAFYGGAVPTSGGHWVNGIMSTVLSGDAIQEVSYDPSLNTGTRKRLTVLDAAALVDIGWEIDLPELLPGDYNRNGVVDAADYTVWRNTLGSTTDLRANGNNSGASANKIDQADYTFWKSHFGNVTGSGALFVPEPASTMLLSIAASALLLLNSRRRRLQ